MAWLLILLLLGLVLLVEWVDLWALAMVDGAFYWALLPVLAGVLLWRWWR
ncbi:hypothetical protein [Ferrimonas marina]|uniref:Uncharacterized protein n=1 Tax=Ferrimonas marina TaxID=299255 RepID=A0A1M5X5V5_9GAMM|nr:hypothetical protein [Ferrimonas marina]SHH95205.1 hypothetical protein SAMN02745129_3257 [Ferrimonas marina]